MVIHFETRIVNDRRLLAALLLFSNSCWFQNCFPPVRRCFKRVSSYSFPYLKMSQRHTQAKAFSSSLNCQKKPKRRWSMPTRTRSSKGILPWLLGWKNTSGVVWSSPGEEKRNLQKDELHQKKAIVLPFCLSFELDTLWRLVGLKFIFPCHFASFGAFRSTCKALSTATLMVLFGMPLFSSALRQIVFGPFWPRFTNEFCILFNKCWQG